MPATFAPVISDAEAVTLGAKLDGYGRAWQLWATHTKDGSSADLDQQTVIAEACAATGGVPTNDEISAYEVYDFARTTEATWIGYLSLKAPNEAITTWTGDVICTITSWEPYVTRQTREKRIRWTAKDIHGAIWKGWGEGGMSTRMRRA